MENVINDEKIENFKKISDRLSKNKLKLKIIINYYYQIFSHVYMLLFNIC